MKPPKRIIEILKRKQDFIDQNRNKLGSSITSLQQRLLNDLLTKIYPELNIKDGKITDSVQNYRILSVLDNIYNDFTAVSNSIITSQVVKVTSGIADIGAGYFKIILSGDMGARFDKVAETTVSKMNLRIGLKDGKSVRGGFLDSIIKDNTVSTQIKNYVSKAITGQVDSKDFIKGLTDLINGVPKEVIKDGIKEVIRTGAIEKQYQRYAYDLYQQ
jgi:hypothetical protein